MCAMSDIDFKQTSEFIINDRVPDLDKAIKIRKLEVENIIKLSAVYDKNKKSYKLPVYTKDYLKEYYIKGN